MEINEVNILAGTVVLCAFLITVLLAAFIFSREFRHAVLGGRGEARILGLVSAKGVTIVLILVLLIGVLLFALKNLHSTLKDTYLTGPINMRLNVNFDPNEVNPTNPNFKAEAFLKTAGGDKPIPIFYTVSKGSLSVKVDIPNNEAWFYIRFNTPNGIWKTEDHSVCETWSTAHKQPKLPE